jgi:hypothetical protein
VLRRGARDSALSALPRCLRQSEGVWYTAARVPLGEIKGAVGVELGLGRGHVERTHWSASNGTIARQMI